jgi:hypothetical protein
VFTANAAWLACAAIAHNLTRAAGALASSVHARARTGTLRTQLLNTPGRIARSAQQLVLHLPRGARAVTAAGSVRSPRSGRLLSSLRRV